MTLADDVRWCRERAETERREAAGSTLPNVRNRALRAAERWDQMAARAERAQDYAVNRSGQ